MGARIVKKLFYGLMFMVTDWILWLRVNDADHFIRWYNVSAYYLSKYNKAV